MSTVPTTAERRATLGRSRMRDLDRHIAELEAELKRAQLALREEQVAHTAADKDAKRYRTHRDRLASSLSITPDQIDALYDAMREEVSHG